MEEKQIIIIAVITSFVNLAIICILLRVFFLRLKTELEKYNLRDSTYTLLEHSYWKNQREIKDVRAQLKEAMDDSIEAHKAMDKMYKAIENGTGRNN